MELFMKSIFSLFLPLVVFFSPNVFACDAKEIADIISCNYGRPCFDPENTNICDPNITNSYNESRVWAGIRYRVNEKCGFNVSFKEEFDLRALAQIKTTYTAVDSSGRSFSYRRCATPIELANKIIGMSQ